MRIDNWVVLESFALLALTLSLHAQNVQYGPAIGPEIETRGGGRDGRKIDAIRVSAKLPR